MEKNNKWVPNIVEDASKYLGKIQDLKVLDIGCGAEKSYDHRKPEDCRNLSSFGANVIGIDIYDSPNENYRHIQADLFNQRLENILPKDFSPKLILCKSFLDSPKLNLNLEYEKNRRNFGKSIVNQINNIILPGNYFFFEGAFFIGKKSQENGSIGYNEEELDGIKYLKNIGLEFVKSENRYNIFKKNNLILKQ